MEERGWKLNRKVEAEGREDRGRGRDRSGGHFMEGAVGRAGTASPPHQTKLGGGCGGERDSPLISVSIERREWI